MRVDAKLVTHQTQLGVERANWFKGTGYRSNADRECPVKTTGQSETFVI